MASHAGVSLTKGYTVDEILAGQGGWLGAGFRYVTLDDLSTMFLDAGLTETSSLPHGSKVFLESLVSENGHAHDIATQLGATDVAATALCSQQAANR